MTPWKLVAMVLVALLPGGSLVVLAMAVAKAVRLGRDRFLRRSGQQAQATESEPAAVPMAVPVVVGGKA